MRFRDLRSLAFALTLAVVALTPAAARAQDYTDIWWNAGGTESGWGVNFVQNENIVFATFYIYDVNRQPMWYSAAMTEHRLRELTWGLSIRPRDRSSAMRGIRPTHPARGTGRLVDIHADFRDNRHAQL